MKKYGAGNGDRTRGIKLGKLALFLLSYARFLYYISGFKEVNQHFLISSWFIADSS